MPIARTQMSTPDAPAAMMPEAKSSESPVTNGTKTPTKSAVPAKTRPQHDEVEDDDADLAEQVGRAGRRAPPCGAQLSRRARRRRRC